jgi:2-polyprenyl-3-methyl-5-hydroxy-6-metoxy-1,4-benzoquinol methylase
VVYEDQFQIVAQPFAESTRRLQGKSSTAPPLSLRQAWTGLIDAGDYEAHMASIGQAQANAGLVGQLLRDAAPPPGAAILFAGAGTGQMFDYLVPVVLSPYRTTFTDINAEYLDLLEARLESCEIAYETVVDDVERSGLIECFDLVIAVLVLEHVDWRSAVDTLCRLSNGRVFVVVQEDPPHLKPRVAIGTMQVLREIPSALIDREELGRAFEKQGFRTRTISARVVADGKKMIGIEYVGA